MLLRPSLKENRSPLQNVSRLSNMKNDGVNDLDQNSSCRTCFARKTKENQTLKRI